MMSDKNKEYVDNNARVDKIMNFALRDGLRHFIIRQYEKAYPDPWYEINSVLLDNKVEVRSKDDALAKLDIYAWLKLMNKRWDNVFLKKLGGAETGYTVRGYVNLLQNARNNESHVNDENVFTNESAHHIAVAAIALLKAVNESEKLKGGDSKAKEQISRIEEIKKELGRLIYGENEQKSTEKPVPSNTPQPPADSLNGGQPQADVAVATAPVTTKEKTDTSPANESEKKSMTQSQEPQTRQSEPSHADDAIQQLIRQHQDMMRHMQRQQASHLKTTESANADVIQQLIHQNQEFMQHIQQMQISAASANADVIQQLIRQNQEFMQQASQSTAPANDDAVQRLMRHQALMQQLQQMQASQSAASANADDDPQLIRKNQGVIRFTKRNVVACFIVVIVLLIAGYGFIDWFIDAKILEACDPETLGRRYGGLDHARATIGCWLR